MEIQFQQPNHHQKPASATKFNGKKKNRVNNNKNVVNKFLGVRQRPSGRWVAEIKDTTQKIRMWLGTFETAEEAARAYDEAACLLRGSNTRTNFVNTNNKSSLNSPFASRIRNLLNTKKKNIEPSKPKNTSISADITRIATTGSRNTNSATSSSSGAHSSGTECNYVISNTDLLFNNISNKGEDTKLFEDTYKPDLSNCVTSELYDYDDKLGISEFSWGFGAAAGFGQELSIFPSNEREELTEFERMKVERSISASLHAMNGVQECMELNVHDDDDQTTDQDFWDLPQLCSLLC